MTVRYLRRLQELEDTAPEAPSLPKPQAPPIWAPHGDAESYAFHYTSRVSHSDSTLPLTQNSRPPWAALEYHSREASPQRLGSREPIATSSIRGFGAAGTLAVLNARHESALSPQGQDPSRRIGRHINTKWDDMLARTVEFHSRQSAPLEQIEDPHPPTAPEPAKNGPFDAYLSRDLLFQITDLFFDYIYGLVPYLHRPSYYQALEERREEQPNQEAFVTLVLAVVARTLVQLPSSLLPLPLSHVQPLAQVCFQHVKRFIEEGGTEATIENGESMQICSGGSLTECNSFDSAYVSHRHGMPGTS